MNSSEEPPTKRAKCEHGRQRNGGGVCQHGRRRSTCKECGGASICQHGRVRRQCKDCASIYIGCTVVKQLDGQTVCLGTVVAFKSTGKYTIQYTDGTTAALNKTALKRVLSPTLTKETAAVAVHEPAIETSIAMAEGAGTASTKPTLVSVEEDTAATTAKGLLI